MKRFFPLFLLSLAAFGQTLPDFKISTGASWLRGASYPLNNDTELAVHVVSNWYLSGEVVTPIAKNPSSTAPLPSTITAGASYVLVSTGAFALSLNALGGASAAGFGVAAAPSFSGSVTAEFHKGNLLFSLQAKVSNASYSQTSGALATVVLSPAATIGYAFNKPTPTVAPAAKPTAKQMRVVMKRLGLPVEDIRL